MDRNGKARKYGDGREALLAAVVVLVAEQGLDGFSYRKAADRAGVNNTLISHHFGSKEALLEAATEWAVARSQEVTDLTAGSSLDDAFAERLTRIVAEEPHLQLFQYQMILASGRSEHMRRLAATLYESYVSIMLDVLERYGLPRDRATARTVFAALDGLVLQQVTVASREEIRDSIIKLGQMLKTQVPTVRG